MASPLPTPLISWGHSSDGSQTGLKDTLQVITVVIRRRDPLRPRFAVAPGGDRRCRDPGD